MNATPEGLAEAIGDLERLIESGYSSKDARLLLGKTYQPYLIVYLDYGSTEYEDMRARQHSVYRELLGDYPDDPDILFHFAYTLSKAEDQLPILLKAIEVSPDSAEINFSLGGLYGNALKNHEKGTYYMTRAFELATRGDKITYARHLIDYLRRQGKTTAANRIKGELDRFIEREKSKPRN